MRRLIAIVATVVCWPVLAHACSGTGAAELIAHHARVGAALCLATLLTTAHLFWHLRKSPRRKRWRVLIVVLACLHPFWWLGVSSGDCGYLLFYSSLVAAVVQLAVLAASHLSLRRGAHLA